jgi:hypothetical protein
LDQLFGVMAGLVPPSTRFSLNARKKDVDARDKRGHDGGEALHFIGDAL